MHLSLRITEALGSGFGFDVVGLVEDAIRCVRAENIFPINTNCNTSITIVHVAKVGEAEESVCMWLGRR